VCLRFCLATPGFKVGSPLLSFEESKFIFLGFYMEPLNCLLGGRKIPVYQKLVRLCPIAGVTRLVYTCWSLRSDVNPFIWSACLLASRAASLLMTLAFFAMSSVCLHSMQIVRQIKSE
jgi:hypothetical protein